MAWIDILRSSRLFEHFSPQHLVLLEGLGELQVFSAGEPICTEGMPSYAAYVVSDGAIDNYMETQVGEFVFGRLGAGESFAELVFLDQNVRMKSARAHEQSEVISFAANPFYGHMESDLKFRLAVLWWIWKSLSVKIRNSNRLIAKFFDSAEDKSVIAKMQAEVSSDEHRIPLGDKRRLFEEQRLSSMEIHFLSSLSKARQLKSGETLFREGDSGDHMYVVLDGKIRISKNIAGIGEEALTVLERGDYFGEMALFDNLPRSADAKAATGDTVVLMISAQVLKGVLDINKISSVRLLEILCGLLAKRLREVDEKLLNWYLLSGGFSS